MPGANLVTRRMEGLQNYAKLVVSVVPSAFAHASLAKFAKYFIALLLLVNWKSFPLVWHWRIWAPVFVWGIPTRLRILRLVALFKSKQRALKDEEHFWTANSPVGKDIWSYRYKFNAYSSLDECDYNMHLSNSSYAKNFDYARMYAALDGFPQYLRAGGFMALAATHYHFIREIPVLVPYEIHVSVLAWDQKWIYVCAQYLTKNKKESKKSHKLNAISNLAIEKTPAKPEDIHSSINSPSPGTPPESFPSCIEVPEGYTLHTVAISRMVFKIGRITVPPSLVYALNGFTANASDKHYSSSNPPPHWQNVLNYGHTRHGGSPRKLRDFLKGGWREVPESERWWEQAFAGPAEEQRLANLALLDSMKTGMDRFGSK
ncbi:hypothetical protein DL96DRAFT_1598416 [Flagelloscypha sp. PMI_526]|nr:hypothetical protein DL96DRAFT_1598416 [Flagelloscypha sp. PMI_526]